MKARIAIILTIIMLLLSACNMSMMKNLTKTQYSNPSFDSAKLRSGGLAIFPVKAGQGNEGYKRPLGDELSNYAGQAVPGGKTITWQETMQLLNDAGKVVQYQELLETYANTSIIDKSVASELASLVGVNYGLFTNLEQYQETHTGAEVNQNVKARIMIIDFVNGDVVQEINGNTTCYFNATLQEGCSYQDHLRAIAQKALAELPGSNVVVE